MEKFNEEIYKGIKSNGSYEDQYYRYIVIDKYFIFKGWKTSYLSSMKYEFFGVMDNKKQDIFTMDNVDYLQKEFNKEAIEEVTQGIMTQYDYYLNILHNEFMQKISDSEFKRSILYYYTSEDGSNSFSQLFIKNVTPAELKKQLINKIITVNKNINSEAFINKYLTEKKEDIVKEIKQNIFDGVYLDEWNFNYNWNNGIEEAKRLKFSFNNYISLNINKIDLIVNEYTKIYNDPNKLLIKAKDMYYLCDSFMKEHNNKSCYITLKNDLKLKVIDFSHLTYIFETGQEKAITYRLFTNNERIKLETYNEETKGLKREDDLFIEDIKKIEFNNKIIFEEV